MARRTVIIFLTKVAPVFVALLLAWHWLGVSRLYHTMLAAVLNPLYPLFDPTGAVTGVGFHDGEFVVKLLAGGQRAGVGINATDITSNEALLLALYLSSPLLRQWRRFLVFVGVSVILLFVVHGFTVATVSQEALMSQRVIMSAAPFTGFQIYSIPRYNVFYEEMGMYLVVLLLWLPYIYTVLRDVRE